MMNALTCPAVLAALLMPAAAAAQDRPPTRPNAADPGATTPTLVHRSALSTYRRTGGDDPPALPWREANDTVGRIGGWRAYAREAQSGATPAPAASATTITPAVPARPAGHTRHTAPTAPPAPASAPRR